MITKAMIMSLQWEEWKQQTELHFSRPVGRDCSDPPVDGKNGTSLVPQAYVIGNSPYYQALTAMAVESGLRVAKSFNYEYDKYLPEAKGHVILIETHKGTPIVPMEILERHYPNASTGISHPSKSIRIKDTSIVFVDFSELLQPANKTDAGNGK